MQEEQWGVQELGRVVVELCTDAKAAVVLRRHGGECGRRTGWIGDGLLDVLFSEPEPVESVQRTHEQLCLRGVGVGGAAGQSLASCQPAAGRLKANRVLCFLAVLALIGQDPTESEQGRLRTALGTAGDKRRKSCTGAWRFCDRGAHWRGWWAAS